MKNKVFSCCLLAFILLFINKIYAANNISPETFVASQKVIRIFIENAAGFGDQAASLNAMDHLKRMGFNGRFEVIYPDEETKAKIVTLFNLSPNISGDYLDASKNIQFIDFAHQVERIKQGKLDHIALAVNGGMGDEPCSIDNNSCGPAGNDNLAFLGVDKFIMIGPFVRYPSYVYYKDAAGQIHDHVQIPGSDGATKWFVSYSPTLQEVSTYLQNNPNGQALLKQKPAIGTLLNVIQNHKINFLPVYGFSIQAPEKYKTEINAYNKMLQIIAGARYAQLNGGDDANKPLIISVFYDYTLEAQHLQMLLNSDNWGAEEKPESSLERTIIKSLGLKNALIFSGINDPDASNKILNLKPNQILLLWLGPLPKNIFDGLYNHTDTNIWPAIREGASSLNSQLLTGKAHFRCASTRMRGMPGSESWEIGYDLIDDSAFKNRLSNFYDRFCSDTNTLIPWANKPETFVELGQLIIESLNSNTPISQYFSKIKDEALKPENDKVHYDIEQAIND